MDGDADIDFLSAAFNRDEIAWYENGGDGRIGTPKPITFDVRLAVDMWAADLDGDGDNDAMTPWARLLSSQAAQARGAVIRAIRRP